MNVSTVPSKVPGCRPYWDSRVVGPSQPSGHVVHVPDPDVGVLQRKPHPLFRRPQRLDRLMPLGDIGAGAERADDFAGVVSQRGAAPLDQPFVAGPGDDDVFGGGQIAAQQDAEVAL